MKKKNLFLIPGFGQQATDKHFSWLVRFLQSKKFIVIRVPMKWKNKVMADYINQFKEFYIKNKSNNNYVLGFSYGAVIAFATATELKPRKIYLCSLSPYFKEDLIKMKPWTHKLIGKNRMADSKTRSGKRIAKKLITPTVLFYGEKEARDFPQLKLRSEETVKLSKNSKLIIVKKAPHDISNPNYMEAIKKEFK